MSFNNYAEYAQDLKGIIREAPTFASMSDIERECLDVMASALANILVNNHGNASDWKIISNYSKLVEEQWQGLAKTAENIVNPQSPIGEKGRAQTVRK